MQNKANLLSASTRRLLVSLLAPSFGLPQVQLKFFVRLPDITRQLQKERWWSRSWYSIYYKCVFVAMQAYVMFRRPSVSPRPVMSTEWYDDETSTLLQCPHLIHLPVMRLMFAQRLYIHLRLWHSSQSKQYYPVVEIASIFSMSKNPICANCLQQMLAALQLMFDYFLHFESLSAIVHSG